MSGRLGVPALLLFLGIGMLAGSEGPGGIEFDDPGAAQSVAVVALIYILFSGGLQTRWEDARTVVRGALALATVGVVLTALGLGAFAWLAFGMEPLVALLFGSVVASTDAAAVFALFAGSGVRLQGRLRPVLEFESGSNDPMAVFLTTAMLALIGDPGAGPGWLLVAFVREMIFGGLLGFALGRLAVVVTNHVRLDVEGLYPVLTAAFAALIWAVTVEVGGNGFLAVYVAGMVLANSDLIHKHTLVVFHDGLAWLMQIAMFLTLGLLVFPSHLLPVAGQGLLAALFLMFVARPLAVFVTLAPLDYSWREKLLVSWVGLRGAVPIVLATYPMIAGIPEAELIFNLIFFIVLSSAVLQGTSLVPVARWLGLQAPEPKSRRFDPRSLEPLEGRLQELHVEPGSALAGRPLVGAGIPKESLILLVFRGDGYVVPRGSTVIEEGDRLLVLAGEPAVPELERLLSSEVR